MDNNAEFKTRKTRRNPKPKSQVKEIKVPKAVLSQLELRQKYKYTYHTTDNGNIQNNSTIYVVSDVAYHHQIDAKMLEAVTKAKSMPEIFGKDFECDYKINVVRRYTGEYIGYAFIDITNPKLYYALLGFNVDGSDRAEYIDDPEWIRPEPVLKEKKEKVAITMSNLMSVDWCCSSEEEYEKPLASPKLRKALPSLLSLGEYEYDEQQKEHFESENTHGTLTLLPAFIIPGIKDEYDECSLYVSEVPAVDYDFLYNIFARYARTDNYREKDKEFFPRINIKECNKNKNDGKTGIFAIVEFSCGNDAAFALNMMQRVRASYNGKDVMMSVRYAFKSKNNKK